ncbi:MAG: helix-turn-helix domain-containing protein [Clostridiales bacterium]|nr:helix-turn-helix domain-containing protein [Clostridiales bacterium]
MQNNIKKFNRQVFADRLKELRTEKKIGQNQLAEELGLSNASISYWETGKQEPSASALFKLAQYFDVGLDYLLGLKDY